MRAAYQADVAGDLADAQGGRARGDRGRRARRPPSRRARGWRSRCSPAGRATRRRARRRSRDARRRASSADVAGAAPARSRAHGGGGRARSTPPSRSSQEARALESRGDLDGDDAARAARATITRASRERDEGRARAETHAAALEAIATLLDRRHGRRGARRRARRPALGAAARRAGSTRGCAPPRRGGVIGQLDRAAATLDRALEAGQRRCRPTRRRSPRPRSPTRASASPSRRATRRRARAWPSGAWPPRRTRACAAALAMRVAEHAAAEGDVARSLEALSPRHRQRPRVPARARAAARHARRRRRPGRVRRAARVLRRPPRDRRGARARVPARRLRLGGPRERRRRREGRAQPGGDVRRAPRRRSAASRARSRASRGTPRWYEEATKRLLAAGGTEAEAVSLYVELVRLAPGAQRRRRRGARAARDGGRPARGMAGARPRGLPRPRGAGRRGRSRAHRLEPGRAIARGDRGARGARDRSGSRAGPARSSRRCARSKAGDVAAARKQAARAAERERPTRSSRRSWRTSIAPRAITRGGRACGVGRGDVHERRGARGRAASRGGLRALARRRPQGRASRRSRRRSRARRRRAKMLLGWASRGVDVDSIDARRRAIERSAGCGATGAVLALERFATGGRRRATPTTRRRRSPASTRARDGDVGVAGRPRAARLVGQRRRRRRDARAPSSASRRAAREALLLATAEQVRLAREADDARGARARDQPVVRGGRGPARGDRVARGRERARASPRKTSARASAVAAALSGDAREAMLASAALLEPRIHPFDPAPLVVGDVAGRPPREPRARRRPAATRAAAAPRCSRSARALGDDAAIDARRLAGWSSLAAGDARRGARGVREGGRPRVRATSPRGRGCARAASRRATRELRARAASELGARCSDAARGAAFWEEAALTWLELGDDANADARPRGELRARRAARRGVRQALPPRARAQGQRQPPRPHRAPPRGDRRAAAEIQKLFWEQARVLREKGDQDGALNALEHVTMLDPDHVGRPGAPRRDQHPPRQLRGRGRVARRASRCSTPPPRRTA